MAPQTDHAALLDLIADVQGLLAVAEFHRGLLEALSRAIPSDYISLNEIGPNPHENVVLVRPEISQDHVETFNRLSHENPLVARYRRTRDGRPYRFSDVVTPAELHALAIYRELYEPLGIEHQMAFTLPTGPDRILGVVMSRSALNFSDAERDLLDDARSFIIQAYQNARAFEGLRSGTAPSVVIEALGHAGLTRREAEVMALIAFGNSNADAGRKLGVAERTVAKHLERSFAKLGAKSRSEAAARAWELARSFAG